MQQKRYDYLIYIISEVFWHQIHMAQTWGMGDLGAWTVMDWSLIAQKQVSLDRCKSLSVLESGCIFFNNSWIF